MHAIAMPQRTRETMRAYDKIDELKEEVRRLRDQLMPEIVFPPRWRLTGREREVLTVLLARAPLPRHKQVILDAIAGASLDPPVDKVIDIYICKLRQKLAPDGITIGTMWRQGYFISTESAERIRAMIAAEERGENTRPDRSVIIVDAGKHRANEAIEHHGKISSPTQLREVMRTLYREGVKRWPKMVEEDIEDYMRAVLR